MAKYISGAGASPSDNGIPRSVEGYLAAVVEEGGRNAALYAAASQLRDADFSTDECVGLLRDKALTDGLPPGEIEQCISSVYNGTKREPATGGGSTVRTKPHVVKRVTQNKPEKNFRKIDVSTVEPVDLPKPLGRGFERLLEVGFEPGEGVAIADTTLNADGRRTPKAGVVADRDKRLEASQATPDGSTGNDTQHDLYIRINPMSYGGKSDKDVTAYRHVLVEFDEASKEKQYGALLESNLPIAAIIDSGNKSVHGWVCVDAKNLEEYQKRAASIYELFPQIDPSNKNPSRFSRCPQGKRTLSDGVVVEQTLLDTNVGAESWEDWEESQEVEEVEEPHEAKPLFREADLGEPQKFSELLHHDFAKDADNLIGKDRWLCKGSSLFIIGQSGVGKSSLNAQLVVGWGLPNPELTFGIETERPLRQLIIQHENDKGDLAEMVQGVQRGLKLNDDQIKQLDELLEWRRITTLSGQAFLAAVEELVIRHQSDICWIDPYLAYIEGDASKQENNTEFLYRGLTPISERTGVIFAMIHHTGKPVKDKVELTESDLAYMGLGSSIQTNWAREVLVMNRVSIADGEPPTFRLTATKRRQRAGMTTMVNEGEEGGGWPASNIYIRHSSDGSIKWEQCPAPVKGEGGRKVKPQNDPAKLREYCELAGKPLSATELKKAFTDGGGADGSFKNVLPKALGEWKDKDGKEMSGQPFIEKDNDGHYIPSKTGKYSIGRKDAA